MLLIGLTAMQYILDLRRAISLARIIVTR